MKCADINVRSPPLPQICPICAALPGGDPNHVTDDFAAHLTLEHRAPRDLISFYNSNPSSTDEPYSSHVLTVKRVELVWQSVGKKEADFEGFCVETMHFVSCRLLYHFRDHQGSACSLEVTFVDIFADNIKASCGSVANHHGGE